MLNTVRRTGLVISLAGFAISVNTLPALVTWFSTQFGIPVATFGVIFLLQFGAFTLCSMTVGRLHASHRLPLYGIVLGSLAISSVCLFFIGVLPGFYALVIAMIIIGGAGGLVESIGTTLLTSSEGSNRMLYTSQFFYALGAFLAPSFVGYLLNRGANVPTIGRLVGLFSLAIGTVVWLLVYQPWSNRRLEREPMDSNISCDESPTELGKGAITVNRVSLKAFPLLFLTMVSYVMIESAVGNWFAVYVDEALSFTAADASFTLSLFWIGLGISRLFSMIFIIKHHPRILLIHMGLMLIAAFMLLLPLAGQGRALLFFAIFLLGFGCGPIWPLLIEYCSRIFAQEHLLMYLVGAGSVGALLGPIVTSSLFSLIGIDKMHILFLAYVVIMVATAIITVGITKRSHKIVA